MAARGASSTRSATPISGCGASPGTGDKAYGVGYGCGNDRSVRLYSSNDGKKFDTLVERLFDVGYPNETSLVFDGDTCYCLLRRDDKPNSGLLGVSQPPYTKWEWKDLGVKIGGPQMIRLTDGRFVAAVRLYDGAVRTSLAWVDPRPASSANSSNFPPAATRATQDSSCTRACCGSAITRRTKARRASIWPRSDWATTVRDIGSRRELFVDDYLIEQLRDRRN